jgi:hypothetical protein
MKAKEELNTNKKGSKKTKSDSPLVSLFSDDGWCPPRVEKTKSVPTKSKSKSKSTSTKPRISNLEVHFGSIGDPAAEVLAE